MPINPRNAKSILSDPSILFLSAERGDTDFLLDLIKDKEQANLRNEEGFTLLMLAAEHGQTETVVLLEKLGANVNFKMASSFFKISALALAAENGYTDTVKALVRLGADKESMQHALLIAAKNGETKTVALLARLGVDINFKIINPSFSEVSALALAAQNGHTDTVGLLIDLGADEESMHHAFLIAAQNGKQAVVDKLSYFISLNVQDSQGMTALMLAITHGHTAIMKNLIKWGADLHIRDLNGLSALELAQQKGILNLIDEEQEPEHAVSFIRCAPWKAESRGA